MRRTLLTCCVVVSVTLILSPLRLSADPVGQDNKSLGPGIAPSLSRKAGLEVLRTMVAQADALWTELQKDAPDADKREQWFVAYRTVSRLQRRRLVSGLPGRADMSLWRELRQLEGRLSLYLEKNKQHVDEFSASVEEARRALAMPRTIRRKGEASKRTLNARSALTRLNTLIKTHGNADKTPPDMVLEASRVRLELMLHAGDQLGDGDIREHISVAFRLNGRGGFQDRFDHADFLSRRGWPTGARLVELLMERAGTNEERELVLYSRLELLHREQNLKASQMLRLAEEFLRHYRAGRYANRVVYIQGDSYFSMGRMADAVAAFDRIRRADPDTHQKMTLRICAACRMDGKYDRALEELKTITPTPENENTLREMREKIEESARRASARDTGDGG